ncbi:MAG: tRNA pseudouridine synthase B [Candidatus Uhrbacteria bacterium GW2011_GWE2_40_58]|nr:MAG: tRNA pseudouridine synthase B [Candidatus Uhrbacteria bacterium GW2011_GWF2_40_263]KKR67617.1 MAG: tRNA pseudouridine synthase B [Candidatus Uhrbacteria bacterium GW2011_GWE2_40_58]HBK34938.1 tRNA pseudouridine(55) synthase TruB [Candidatus Uhrbacteria bacterium]HCB55866.1 tRNA pseudouridine(55) synthase TruB [Candidatus Uhrbacteria bacterium]
MTTSQLEGFLLINKPTDFTSHDVVNVIRKITGIRRTGHAGTLDPFATGLLIVGVGRGATKHMQKLVGLEKTYKATFVLGASSDTDDVTGTLIPQPLSSFPSENELQTAIASFLGPIQQIPPAYSAIKIKGQKMYEAARKGKPIHAEPRSVVIYHYDLISPLHLENKGTCSFSVTISCSSGTYIRALARDLGHNLNTGGYVKTLERTRIGPFSLNQSQQLEDLTSDNWITYLLPVEKMQNTLKISL